MATVTVTLDDEIGKLIDEKVAQYGYASASSYVRDLIRRDDEAHAEWLRRELQKGLDSGISPYTVEEAFSQGFAEIDRVCGPN